MATSNHILAFFLILLNWQSFAKTEEQQLSDWTKENETKLLEKHPIIYSTWFSKECLELANKMEISRINQCQIFRSKHINAYVFNNGHVYFSSALLKLLNNKHQWASILAHENAHIELEHYLKTLKKINKPGIFFPKSRINKLFKKHEKDADAWSEKQLLKYGFDSIQIVYFLKRIKKLYGNTNNNHHLKLSERIKKTGAQEIVDQDFIKKLRLNLD